MVIQSESSARTAVHVGGKKTFKVESPNDTHYQAPLSKLTYYWEGKVQKRRWAYSKEPTPEPI